jgi:hypothetical protein
VGGATVLVDGFIQAMWNIERAGAGATLVIEPFEPLAPRDRTAVVEEGARLLTFAAGDAQPHNIRFTGSG